MFLAQIRKRHLARLFKPYFRVVPQIPAAVSPVYANCQSVFFKSGESIKRLPLARRGKFRYRILSSIAWNFWAYLTTGLMLIIQRLQEIFKSRATFLSTQKLTHYFMGRVSSR